MTNIIIKKSKIKGKGIFAARDFNKGELVIKWKPKVLTKKETEKLNKNQKHYCLKISNNKYYLMQSPEKYVNHSCQPNTSVINDCDVAIRNIKKGEEITSDYGKEIIASFICFCGSNNCRKIIK